MARILEEVLVAMNFTKTKSTLQGALKERNLALLACIGLTVGNVLLGLKIFNMEERWVLIPQQNPDNSIEVSSKQYSNDYFINWANDVVTTLLCVNPDSIEWKTQKILRITTETYGTLKENLLKDAQRIKGEKISTVFYPKAFTVNQAKKTVDVTGDHIAYFGKDTTPVTTTKTFRLTWIIRKHGIVLLADFIEVKDEKK